MEGKKIVATKAGKGWKVYTYDFVGGGEVVARNDQEAENMIEGVGNWDFVFEEVVPINDYALSDGSHSDPKGKGGAGCDFTNFHLLSPQAQRAVQAIVDKLLTEEN